MLSIISIVMIIFLITRVIVTITLITLIVSTSVVAMTVSSLLILLLDFLERYGMVPSLFPFEVLPPAWSPTRRLRWFLFMFRLGVPCASPFLISLNYPCNSPNENREGCPGMSLPD